MDNKIMLRIAQYFDHVWAFEFRKCNFKLSTKDIRKLIANLNHKIKSIRFIDQSQIDFGMLF